MKAAVIEKQGGIENIVYREFADPVVGPRDVLVRCKAVGLNYFDIFVRHAPHVVRHQQYELKKRSKPQQEDLGLLSDPEPDYR